MTKFKRLIKKSWDTITLYHGTNSETLMGVMESGYIYPGGYIDKTSNGLFDTFDEDGYPLPSLAQDGVYLTNTEERAEYYASDSMYNTNKFLPVVLGVVFKVTVQTDALLPDYDDIAGKFSPEWIQRAKEKLKERGENPEEYWRQSIYEVEQVVHVGPISTSEIEGVMFVDDNIIERGISYKDVEKLLEESGIQFHTWMSFSEATSKFKEFLKKVEKKVNQY